MRLMAARAGFGCRPHVACGAWSWNVVREEALLGFPRPGALRINVLGLGSAACSWPAAPAACTHRGPTSSHTLQDHHEEEGASSGRWRQLPGSPGWQRSRSARQRRLGRSRAAHAAGAAARGASWHACPSPSSSSTLWCSTQRRSCGSGGPSAAGGVGPAGFAGLGRGAGAGSSARGSPRRRRRVGDIRVNVLLYCSLVHPLLLDPHDR